MAADKENDVARQVAEQYDGLSRHYEDWFSVPWETAVAREADALQSVLRAEGVTDGARVLDLTCGMGTQAIGLAQKGYDVTAMDISTGQLALARDKAAQIIPETVIEWVHGDAVRPADFVDGPFDAVISFANSFPLLGSADAMRQSLTQACKLLAPAGKILISMRDHTAIRAEKPYLVESGAVEARGKKGVWLETAAWCDDERYESHIMFIYTEPEYQTYHYPFPPLYAVTQDEFKALLKESGFVDARFLDGGQAAAFSCPVYCAAKP